MSQKIPRILQFTAIALLIYLCIAFLYIITQRVNYPYVLEWMESLVFQHSMRSAQGMPDYVRPSAEFVPSVYSPMYFWIGGYFIEFLGMDIPSLRMLSVLCTLLSASLILAMAVKCTRSLLFGLFGAMLFIATFKLGGFWFDLARVDAMAILWLLCIPASMLLAPRRSQPILLGVFFALAVMTKQICALFLLLPLIQYRKQRARLSILLATSGILLAGGFIYMAATSGIWAFYTTIYLPIKSPFLLHKFMILIKHHLATGLFPLLVFNLWAWIYLWRRDYHDDGTRLFAGMSVLGAIAMIALYSHPGGYRNDILYFSTFLVGLAALQLHKVISHIPSYSVARWWKLSIIWGLMLVQLAFWSYHPVKQVPAAKDREYHESLVQMLRTHDRVWAPYHTMFSFKAGKEMGAFLVALDEVYHLDKKRFPNELLDRIKAKEYDLIIFDRTRGYGHQHWLLDYMLQYYDKRQYPLFSGEDGLPQYGWTLAGMACVPDLLLTPIIEEKRLPDER